MLLALALSAVVLAVLMRTVGMQLSGLARMMPRYEALLLAQCQLEVALEQRSSGEEERDFWPFPSEPGEGPPCRIEISNRVTTADPRLEEIRLHLSMPNGQEVTLNAYRLRARHQDEPPMPSPTPSDTPSASPSATPTPTQTPGGTTPQPQTNPSLTGSSGGQGAPAPAPTSGSGSLTPEGPP